MTLAADIARAESDALREKRNAKRRKYRPGVKLDWPTAILLINSGRYVYHNDKPLHPGWLMSWPLRAIIQQAQYGRLRAAVPND